MWRFGPFEVDSTRPEVRSPGSRIKLQDLPHRLLVYLLDRPGVLVTREELRQYLWPENHFVDFEHGLNTAIKKLRSALSDSAIEPRYIETVPRRGYIFKAEVHRESRRGPHSRWLFGSIAAVLATAAILIVSTRSANVNPAVAVLPLENLSPESDQAYFADGLTETLITDLGRLGAFRVIARPSVVHYKGTRKTSHEIGRELNARWLVTGAVARAGSRIRITVQLAHATKDQNVWSETYERDVRDVLALQDEVARAIARRVSSAVAPSSRSRVVTHLVIPDAEEAYLRGVSAMDEYTRDGLEKSVAYFEAATRKDPQYADAWAALAEAYTFTGLNQIETRQEAMSRMEIAARRALQLDDRSSQARVALADVQLWQWSWRAAEKSLRAAVALNPSDSSAHWKLGYLLGALGQPRQAVAEMQAALDLDPLSPSKRNSLGLALYWSRRDDEAINVLRQVPDGDENTFRRHRRLAEIYEEQHLDRQAMAETFRWVELSVAPERLAGLKRQCAALPYAQCKRMALMLDIEQSQRKSQPVRIAGDFALLGNRDEAFRWLAKAIDAHDPGVMYLNVDRHWHSLRSDPRFAQVLRRIGVIPAS
jgi:TolB-like protein/DNA-binding winged helix-turn-helix (wHTH) protein/Tfp pilus assembly protein PilF